MLIDHFLFFVKYTNFTRKMTGPLCQFSGALGEPGTGSHAYRLQVPFGGPDLALVDLLLTAVGALAIAWYWSDKVTLWNVGRAFAGLWLLGIVLHWAFCVDTGLSDWFNGLM